MVSGPLHLLELGLVFPVLLPAETLLELRLAGNLGEVIWIDARRTRVVVVLPPAANVDGSVLLTAFLCLVLAVDASHGSVAIDSC